MGSYLSRNVDRVENISDQPSSSHSFPPSSGPYFAPYYFMGSEKFETSQPESYLFGENTDLQYLGPTAQSFSYKMPSSNELVQALKCLVNIRKDSLRLIRAPNAASKPDDVISTSESLVNDENSPPQKLYNLEFTFDADCPCSIQVFYNAAEKISNKHAMYSSKSSSDLIRFNAGSNQQFCLPTHVINPANLHKNTENKFTFECIPVVIQVSVDAGPAFDGHSHIAYATFEQAMDESWTIKLLKQKQMIDGVCYIIQEIYGIENKFKSKKEEEDGSEGECQHGDSDDGADNTECVVCLSDMKDTIILPCKHLCLCNSCANQIRFQQSGCPICRQSFRALLQIRAVRKITNSNEVDNDTSSRNANLPDEEYESLNGDEADHRISLPPLPEGYEAVPLIDAINGPMSNNQLTPIPTLQLRPSSSARSRLNSATTTTTTPVAQQQYQRSSSRRKKKSSTMIEMEDETSNNVLNTVVSNINGKSQEIKKRRSKRHNNHTNKTSLELTPVTDSRSYEENPDEYQDGNAANEAAEVASVETSTTRASYDVESIERRTPSPSSTPDDDDKDDNEIDDDDDDDDEKHDE